MNTIRIGICGLGTVAGGTIAVLQRNAALIEARCGSQVEVVRVASRRRRDNIDLSGIAFSDDVMSVPMADDVDVVVELIGGYEQAREIVMTAIAHGKHVVTANKALIAVHGNEIFAAAREQGVIVAYEASVAGGIPVIKALREGLGANRIEWLAGIINGTSNFILTEMREKGRPFADVLSEAQALGYAEADPTFDVEGIDAAHKLTILASAAFGLPLNFDALHVEGISTVTPDDISHARELGYRIKHLGIARRRGDAVEVRVHPTLVPETHLLASVDGVMNAVLIEGDAVGQTLFCGRGAGAEPTASAVIADIIDVVRTIQGGGEPMVPHLGFVPELMQPLGVSPMSHTVSAYYLRIFAADRPGVLAKIATVISRHGINIESIMQKEFEEKAGQIPVILLTHEVEEQAINDAIAEIEALEDVNGPVRRLRVEALAE